MNDLTTAQISATAPVSIRLNKHFVSCSAAAAGAAFFFGGAAPADAAIVFSGLQNIPIHNLTVDGGVYINVEPPFNFVQGANLANGWDLNPYKSGQAIYIAGNTQIVGAASAVNLGFDSMIDASQAFTAVSFAGAVGIPVGGTGYLGFKFDPQSEAGAQTWYGWVRMTVGNNADTDGAVLDWAYDDSGAGIKAGAVPEPSSLAALALGAAGLLTLRQRRARA